MINYFTHEISERCGLSEYMVSEITNAMSNYISEQLVSGEAVEIPKIGTFKTTSRKKMVGNNLIGCGQKELPECTYPIFQVSNSIKSKVKSSCQKSC